MKLSIETLNNLVSTGKTENIELAFMLCESQGIDSEELESVRKYVPIINWLDNYHHGYQNIKMGLINCLGLEVLDLEFTITGNLPYSIGLLNTLDALFLDDNYLTCLPDSLGELSLLEILSLSGNKLIKLPESIGNLSELEVLNLGKNNLSCLPESIGNLTNLKRLNLYNNKLIKLPESFYNLKNITQLDLRHNPLDLGDYMTVKVINKLKLRGVSVELN